MFVRTLASALVTLTLTAGTARAQATLVFRNVAVVDLDAGTVRPDMIVEVANGRVTRVEPQKKLPNLLRDLREMHAAGVRFLAGSDAAVAFMYAGFSLHGERVPTVVSPTPADTARRQSTAALDIP